MKIFLFTIFQEETQLKLQVYCSDEETAIKHLPLLVDQYNDSEIDNYKRIKTAQPLTWQILQPAGK